MRTIDDLYLAVLQGKSAVLGDGYYGFRLTGDGEFISVQGAGSWAHRSEDKSAFMSDAYKLTERYGDGTLDSYKIGKGL